MGEPRPESTAEDGAGEEEAEAQMEHCLSMERLRLSLQRRCNKAAVWRECC